MNCDDLPLQIPVSRIAEFLTCPICMSSLKKSTLTPCGHRYCEECIKECLDRQRRCPCCNHAVSDQQLIRDTQYDQLIGAVKREEEISEKEYFENLINEASMEAAEGTSKQQQKAHLSPVELVLRDHLKHSLAAHETYFQDLKRSFQQRIHSSQAECERLVVDLHTQDLTEEEHMKQKTDIEDTYKRQIATLESELVKCGKLVAEAYDRYLSDHLPDLSILPVTTTITVLGSSVILEGVKLKPQDSTEDIKALIEAYCESKDDPIISYGSNARLIYFGPFSKRSDFEMLEIASSLVELGATNPDIFILPDGSRPLLQYAAKPGCVIGLYGQVQFKSDLPKQCFATLFHKGQQQTVDYFTCHDCSFKWICRSCMETCHKEHTVVPYIMNHQPTWACCYCPKKMACLLTAPQ